jgi:hypothetical protein
MASIVFRNVRLIDGIADQPRDGVSLVVEGERIRAVGGAEIPVPGKSVSAILCLESYNLTPLRKEARGKRYGDEQGSWHHR